MTDLERVLQYLERLWMPPDVKAAYDRLRHLRRYNPAWTGLGYDMLEQVDGRYLRVEE